MNSDALIRAYLRVKYARVEDLTIVSVSGSDLSGDARALLSNGSIISAYMPVPGQSAGKAIHNPHIMPLENREGYRVIPWKEGAIEISSAEINNEINSFERK